MAGKITPIDDPSPFSEVLGEWMARHGLSDYRAGPILGTSNQVVGKWRRGIVTPRHERAVRALMTLINEGRA